MRLVSPILKNAVYPTLSGLSLLHPRKNTQGVSVVTYRGVLPRYYVSANPLLDANLIESQMLDRQLQLLRKHYNVITPQNLLHCLETGETLPERAVLITCDDGLRNNLTDMLPVLKAHNVECLFFVTAQSAESFRSLLWYEELYLLLQKHPQAITSLMPAELRGVGASFHETWWKLVENASRLSADARKEWLASVRSMCGTIEMDEISSMRFHFLNRVELKALAEQSVIGAHTCTHPVLSLCSDEEVWREIDGSKKHLSTVCGQSVWAFAFPFGNPTTMGDREVALVEEAGFECAFVNVLGGFQSLRNRYKIGRTHVTSNMNLGEFEAHISGFYSRLRHRLGVG